MRSRPHFVSIVFFLYLLPLLIICGFSTLFSTRISPWSTFSVGLLLAVVGALLFFSMLLQWAEGEVESINEPPPEETPSVNLQEMEALHGEIKVLKESLQRVEHSLESANNRNDDLFGEWESCKREREGLRSERELYCKKLEGLEKEFENYKISSESAIDSERNQLLEAQKTIAELRSTVDLKQRQNEKLDQKIKDLTYEIKTLLQIADMSSLSGNEPAEQDPTGCILNEVAHEYQVPLELVKDRERGEFLQLHHPDEAKLQLKRCIDIAQKITGSHHFSTHKSRFGDLVLDNYALDLRRLCDSLRSENQNTVFVYSPKERKLLFINNQVRDLLGWPPDKFVQDFNEIVQEGMAEWNSSLSQLSTFNQSQTRFVMRAKTGKDLLIHCQLGLIPTGVFRNNVIGVLYPA